MNNQSRQSVDSIDNLTGILCQCCGRCRIIHKANYYRQIRVLYCHKCAGQIRGHFRRLKMLANAIRRTMHLIWQMRKLNDYPIVSGEEMKNIEDELNKLENELAKLSDDITIRLMKDSIK